MIYFIFTLFLFSSFSYICIVYHVAIKRFTLDAVNLKLLTKTVLRCLYYVFIY